ncbi:MAG: PLP-dependent aminotransferase family protein, partial [Caldilineaceae bacterium]
MSLDLHLERAGHAPLYRQIAEQIRERISEGALPPGTQLPTVRALAAQLGVTRSTVQTAYADLQSGGWIEATVGRGTFVGDAALASRRLPDRALPLTPAVVIDDMIQMASVQGVRSLANASPDSRLFPADEFYAALGDLRSDFGALAEYGPTQGDAGLRVELAALLAERGVLAMPDEIVVTNGATQALSLICRALCRSGDAVLVEQPTYLSFLNILRSQGIEAVGVPMDDEGPVIDALARMAVQMRPRFFYTIPTYQNPTGICMSPARRAQVAEVARRLGFLVVEDDIYARMALDGPPPAALKSLDSTGNIIYVSSLSKTLMPGLRVGWVTAAPSLLRRLIDLRRADDLSGPLLTQLAAARFLRNDGLKRHLRRVLPIYRERRDALLGALAASMPAGARWTRPHGGLCVWLTLPVHPPLDDLYTVALRHGWAFAPGSVFEAQRSDQQSIRICFGQQPPDILRAGVA